MITFKDLRVKANFGFEFMNISFSIEDTIEDLTRYRFDLYRSHYEGDEFKPVHTDIQNFECNDYSANLLNDEIRYIYKIKAINIDTNQHIFSNQFDSPDKKDDNYASYFLEVYNMYLDIIGNDEIILLKRKRTGELCDCYDDVRGSRKSDKCTDCFGTGYKGGFYPPMRMKACYLNTESIQENMDIKGTFEANGPRQLWTLNYPTIQENDIIIDTLTNEKFMVSSWQPSVKNGFMIRQMIQMNGIPTASIYQKIPV